jgi:hypothetical protein
MKFDKETLESFEKSLIEKGYKRMRGHYKAEDYALWKSFHVTYDEDGDKIIGYQIAFLVYDFGKYERFDGDKPFSIACEFLLGNNKFIDRVDLTASDDKITVEFFEKMCEKFYKNICKNYIFKNHE